MIATTLKDMGRYKGLGANLDTAIAWLEAGGWENLPEGKREIAGESVFALVQRYDSKVGAKCRFEAHRDYIDIQLLVSGAEIMETRAVEGLVVTEPYKPDIEFYGTPEGMTATSVLLIPGTAAILFPEDAHRPCMAIGGNPRPIHKIVIKVAL